jgi:hypothetical protein
MEESYVFYHDHKTEAPQAESGHPFRSGMHSMPGLFDTKAKIQIFSFKYLFISPSYAIIENHRDRAFLEMGIWVGENFMIPHPWKCPILFGITNLLTKSGKYDIGGKNYV